MYHAMNGEETVDSNDNLDACLLVCLSTENCTGVFTRDTDHGCQMNPTSPYQLDFMDSIVTNGGWELKYKQPEKPWIPIAKFSASDGNFEGNNSDEIWSNPGNSPNDEACAIENLAQRCQRHYVHRHLDWLLGLTRVNRIKISLYENGTEAAWAIFEKKPGSDDNWFQPSRVIDSFPWDTELLRSSAEMSLGPQVYNKDIRFSILKSDPQFRVTRNSPHRYWMKNG